MSRPEGLHARADAALALLLIAGLACVFLISRRLDTARPHADASAAHEELYVTPAAARRLALAFDGLAADWYWLRSLQYVGRKAVAARVEYTLDDLGPLGLDRLAPMLELTTALDPRFMAAYEFGAVVLPAVDDAQAVRFVERGIGENPGAWRLYQHLGYIHWQAGRYAEASEAYRAGARVAGAPGWLEAMAAQVQLYGGSRETARQLYRQMFDAAEDERIRGLAYKRLLQIQSLDERDAIRGVLADFRARAARCPVSWREAAPALRAARLPIDDHGAPLDPSGTPYLLDPATCDVSLGRGSQIPAK